MKLQPLDIKRQTFARGFRGYEPTEVDAFLKQVADQQAALMEDLRQAEERVREADAKLKHYERVEMALQEALETARDTGRRAEEAAERESRAIIQRAEAQAEEVLREAERERYALRQDVRTLSSRQTEVAARLRGFLLSELEILAQFQGDEPSGYLKLQPASSGGAVPPALRLEAPIAPADDDLPSTAAQADEPVAEEPLASEPPPDGPPADDTPSDEANLSLADEGAAAALPVPEAPPLVLPDDGPLTEPFVFPDPTLDAAPLPASAEVAALPDAAPADAVPAPEPEPAAEPAAEPADEPVADPAAETPPHVPSWMLPGATAAPALADTPVWETVTPGPDETAAPPAAPEDAPADAPPLWERPVWHEASADVPADAPADVTPDVPLPTGTVASGWTLHSLVTGAEAPDASVAASEAERERIRRILDELD